MMTSMAFLLGVVPLVLATGAGAESRRSIGTGAFGGVLAATMFGLVFAPVAFRVVVSVGRRGRHAAVTKRDVQRVETAENLEID